MASSSVKCEVRIIGAKNIVTKRNGALFIRCFLSVGKNRRIQLNTREISSKKDDSYMSWDETFSLECNGLHNSVSNLQDEKIVFELRWRNTKANFLGQACSSQMLACAEMAWKNVFDATNMEIVKWVFMTRKGSECNEEICMKPPALQIGVKVEVPEMSRVVSREEMRRRRRCARLKNWDDCGCGMKNGGFCSCSSKDNELFLVAAVLDVC